MFLSSFNIQVTHHEAGSTPARPDSRWQFCLHLMALVPLIFSLLFFAIAIISYSQPCNTANASLLANPSFESNSGCPNTYQQFSLVSNWVSGNSEAIDYLNTCGFTRFTGMPFPDGNGIAGCYYFEDRLRYIAQCLPTPLSSGTNYTLNFEISALSIDNASNMQDAMVGTLCAFNYNSIPYPVTVVLYGTSNCSNLPWGGTGAPPAGWTVLGQAVMYPSDTLWKDFSISFTPSSTIAAVAIGPPASQNSKFPLFNEGGNGNIGCFPFIQYDNFILNQSNLVIDVEIARTGGFCTNDLVFTAACNLSGGTWQWYKDGVALAGETNAVLQVSANSYGIGKYTVTYTSGSNCYKEDYFLKLPNGIITDFSSATSCMENIVAFTDLSFGGAHIITQWQWDFGDSASGGVSSEKDPVHRYAANGNYTVKLVITTSEGCKDSISKTQVVNKPTPLDISDCDCGGLGISLIPNYSFEDHSCCPSNYSQLNCADTWIQASDATSDYLNTCGFTAGAPPLSPPDGNGFAGYIDLGPGYKEYIGACLVEPMKAGNSYNLTFQMAGESGTNEVHFAFWGATDCNDLPFGGKACPQGIGSWKILNQQNITLIDGQWKEVTLSLTLTEDIYAVLIGPDCGNNPTCGGIYCYYFVDDLKLSSSILQPIVGMGSYCSQDLTIYSGSASDSFQLEYQWFKDNIELPGETDTVLYVSAKGYGPGDYRIMGIFRESCDISLVYHVDSAYIDFDISTFDHCGSSNDTQVFIQNVAGVGYVAPYQFQMDNNAPAADSVFTNLSSGEHLIKITDSKGCWDTVSVTVNVFPIPQPSFTFENVCLNDSVFFVDSTTLAAGTVSLEWDFGDGAVDSVQNPAHFYAAPGSYTVTLAAVSDQDCAADTALTVTVDPLPQAAFNSTPVCLNKSPTVFSDASSIASGSIISWNWDFGDGGTSSTQNPDYAFSSDSSHHVILIVESDKGCADTVENIALVHSVPVALFSADSVCLNIPTSFENNSVIDTVFGDSISTWIWTFGDGSPLESGQNPQHIYAAPGVQNVTLIVQSNFGCLEDTTFQVIVHPLPVAHFTANAACLNQPPTQFTDVSTVITGAITAWEWNFGDPASGGTASTQQHPSHSYASDRVYTVQLVVATQYNCTDTASLPVEVYAVPSVNFVADTLSGCQPLCVNFSDLTTINSGALTSLNWDFGNGATLTSPASGGAASSCYPDAGKYTVSLIAVTDKNCRDTLVKNEYIEVWPLPVADFSFSPQPTTVQNMNISFTDISQGNLAAWSWTFYNPASGVTSTVKGTSSVQHPQFNFSSDPNDPFVFFLEDTGYYPVQLIVTTIDGCKDTNTKNVEIDPVFYINTPNAFTPNGDGINDYFFPSGIGFFPYRDFNFYIFDRWGDLIFESHRMDDPWDGTARAVGGKEIVQQDVYVWKLQVKEVTDNHQKHNYIGHVTVVR